jgi:hypothetical protein
MHGGLPPGDVGGGAGGGALEIGAAEALTIGPNGQLLASGGAGTIRVPYGSVQRVSGGGSGGGIRLHGAAFNSTGQIIAKGGGSGQNLGAGVGQGGGGRVLVYGMNATLAVGEDLPDITPYGIYVGPVTPGGTSPHGVVVVSPDLTLVPAGQSLQLGGPPTAVQEASSAQPRIELVHRDVRAGPSGELIVPAGGFINPYLVELNGISARVTGSDLFMNSARGELRGTGSVEVELINNAGGLINAIGDTLTFTQTVSNNAGAQINAIHSTLDFQAGLTNDGELNLINTTILGSVTGGAGGAASFVGDNSVSGNLTMTAGDALSIRIGGTSPQLSDSLSIGGNASLAGALGVSLQGGFIPSPGDEFEIVDVAGSLAGTFNGLPDNALVGNFGGTDLFITYQGGDGNDLVLFAAAAGLPGDYNGNNTVDAADYTIWRDALTAGATSLLNDPTPGTVDESDFTYWRAHFGESLGSGAAAGLPGSPAAVPEPASILLLFFGGNALLLAARRAS